MSLRPPHVYRRLNRARMDSSALGLHRDQVIQSFLELEKSYALWAAGGTPAPMVRAAQRFVDLLSDIFLVSRKALTLSDRPRPHRRDREGRLKSEIHGSCSPEGNIRIYLRTACKARPTAFKTLFNTLVHEWVHHYDFEALGDTIHCAGFYHRVGAICRGCAGKTGELLEGRATR